MKKKPDPLFSREAREARAREAWTLLQKARAVHILGSRMWIRDSDAAARKAWDFAALLRFRAQGLVGEREYSILSKLFEDGRDLDASLAYLFAAAA